jgi:hypothetical protein
MIRKISAAIAAASIAFAAVPAMAQAQDQKEEARTTYRIVYLKLKPGADDRWTELGEKYFGPAADAAKLKRPKIHWLMTGPWDIMMVQQMPRGMAALDTHANAERDAVRQALVKIAGSEEAAKKIREESDSLVAESVVNYSHSHP